MSSFGRTLKQLRLDAGITQPKMAELLGVTQPSVSALERSGCVSETKVRQWAEALGFDVELEFVKVAKPRRKKR